MRHLNSGVPTTLPVILTVVGQSDGASMRLRLEALARTCGVHVVSRLECVPGEDATPLFALADIAVAVIGWVWRDVHG